MMFLVCLRKYHGRLIFCEGSSNIEAMKSFIDSPALCKVRLSGGSINREEAKVVKDLVLSRLPFPEIRVDSCYPEDDEA